MTAPAQLTFAPKATLPLDPAELTGLVPLDRGKLYNALDLDSWQRACAEEARRRVLSGHYGDRP